MKKVAPILLAVAVGVTSGLLGAWWPRGEAEPAPAAAVATPPTGEAWTAPGLPAMAGPQADSRLPVRVEVALYCQKVLTRGELSMRRFEQTALARKWSAPSKALATDAEGQAVLPLSPGIYLLTARAAGCAPLHHSLEVKEGQGQHSLELFLSRALAISGSVREASSQQPIGGALITARQQLGLRSKKRELSAEDDAWTAVADSLGRYRIEGLGEGEFVLRASAEGFADGKLSLGLQGEDGKAELSLEPNGSIEGMVRPLTGAATVRLLAEEGRTVFVNADGSFRLTAGSGDHLLLGEDASGATGMVRVSVPPRGAVRGVELKLGPAGKIRGTAALGGAPAVCARVWIRAESDPYELASAQVTADGSFTLERVPPGRYWLFGECPDGEHGDLLGVEPNQAEPVALTLKQAAGLAVRVRDATGQPVIGAEIVVSQPSREPVAAITGPLGQAELSRLVPAVVRVEAKLGSREAMVRRVQLLEGQAVSVELTLLETGTVAGRIDGPPDEVVGINLFAPGVDGAGKRERTRPDGSFEVRVLPGRYKVFPWLKTYQGMGRQKEVEVEAGRVTQVTFVISRLGDHQLEASAPGTIGASFDDGPGGVSISWVIAGSPVDKAGLKQGDLMIAIDGKPLQRSVDAFSRTKGEPGSPVRIAYRRGGADGEVVVTRAGP